MQPEASGSRFSCPSDAELSHRASAYGKGWCTRSLLPVGSVSAALNPAEWKRIQTYIRIAEVIDQRDEIKIRSLCKSLARYTNGSPLHRGDHVCRICDKKHNFLTKVFRLASCHGCSRVVCKSCRVLPSSLMKEGGKWHCKACADAQELWKRSGAWFHGRLPTLNPDSTQEDTVISSPSTFNKSFSIDDGYSTLTEDYDSSSHSQADRKASGQCVPGRTAEERRRMWSTRRHTALSFPRVTSHCCGMKPQSYQAEANDAPPSRARHSDKGARPQWRN